MPYFNLKSRVLLFKCLFSLFYYTALSYRLNCSNGRKGYMGHLTVIMNEIVNAKEKGSNHEIVMSMFNGMNNIFFCPYK